MLGVLGGGQALLRPEACPVHRRRCASDDWTVRKGLSPAKKSQPPDAQHIQCNRTTQRPTADHYTAFLAVGKGVSATTPDSLRSCDSSCPPRPHLSPRPRLGSPAVQERSEDGIKDLVEILAQKRLLAGEVASRLAVVRIQPQRLGPLAAGIGGEAFARVGLAQGAVEVGI